MTLNVSFPAASQANTFVQFAFSPEKKRLWNSINFTAFLAIAGTVAIKLSCVGYACTADIKAKTQSTANRVFRWLSLLFGSATALAILRTAFLAYKNNQIKVVR